MPHLDRSQQQHRLLYVRTRMAFSGSHSSILATESRWNTLSDVTSNQLQSTTSPLISKRQIAYTLEHAKERTNTKATDCITKASAMPLDGLWQNSTLCLGKNAASSNEQSTVGGTAIKTHVCEVDVSGVKQKLALAKPNRALSRTSQGL